MKDEEMPFKEWNALKSEMAVEAFCIEALEMMIPRKQAEATARARMAKSDSNIDQLAQDVRKMLLEADAKELRGDDAKRAQVAADAEKIAGAMLGLM